MREAKKRPSVFWCVYTALLFLGAVAVVVAVFVTRAHLVDYESARPEYAAGSVFDRYYASGDYEALYEAAQISLSPAEGKGDFVRWLQDKTAGGALSYVRVSAELGDSIKYNVKCGDAAFSSFTLKKSGETTRFGEPLYVFDTAQVVYTAGMSVRVSAPSHCSVTLNDYRLPESCVIETGIETESCKHMPQGVAGITYTTYELKDLLFEPRIAVTDTAGRVHATVYDEVAKTHVAEILYDDALQALYGDYAIQAAQTFAAFMQQDAERRAALYYIETGSPLYQSLARVDVFAEKHSGYAFEDVRAGEFYAYDENTFSCRVSFVHVLTGGRSRLDSTGVNKEIVDTTWYYRRVGDRFLIYDRYTH